MSDPKDLKPEAKGAAAAKGADAAKGTDAAKAKAVATSPLPLIGAAVGALVLGSALGIFVVAPRIVAARTGSAAQADSSAMGGHGKKGAKKGVKGKGEHGAEGSVVHKIDNLIVNPAGSQGRRFLMMSVAIEVQDAKVEELLRAQDAKLRDLIIGAIQQQPMDVITSPAGRDSVKSAIHRVVAPLIADAEWVNIYLPQFVLQ